MSQTQTRIFNIFRHKIIFCWIVLPTRMMNVISVKISSLSLQCLLAIWHVLSGVEIFIKLNLLQISRKQWTIIITDFISWSNWGTEGYISSLHRDKKDQDYPPVSNCLIFRWEGGGGGGGGGEGRLVATSPSEGQLAQPSPGQASIPSPVSLPRSPSVSTSQICSTTSH